LELIPEGDEIVSSSVAQAALNKFKEMATNLQNIVEFGDVIDGSHSVTVYAKNFGLGDYVEKVPNYVKKLGLAFDLFPTHTKALVKCLDATLAPRSMSIDSGSLMETAGKYLLGKKGSFIHWQEGEKGFDGYSVLYAGNCIKQYEQMVLFAQKADKYYDWDLITSNCQMFSQQLARYAALGKIPNWIPSTDRVGL
jgi:hypothetical protein